jgi:sugar-specific transcriptional regulator TrmB
MLANKIKEKEIKIRELLDELKATLNSQSKNDNEDEKWIYITSLSHTLNSLKELLEQIKR